MKKKVDVLIVGAGPAGSICARQLARSGLEVALCEKRPKVGVPIRCGEACANRRDMGKYAAFPDECIETEIHGAILNTPDITIHHKKRDIGTVLNREKFDQHLADEAVNAGAKLHLGAHVTHVSQVQNECRQVSVVQNGTTTNIKAGMVVGADGSESLIGRMAGIDSRQIPAQTCSTAQYQLEGECEFPDDLAFWIHYGPIRWGYVWVFPKRRSGLINLGAGWLTPKKKNSPKIIDLIRQFKDEHFPKNKIVCTNGGAVPVSGSLPTLCAERLVLIGDAAHHTDPMTGGGIQSGMESGLSAAYWIEQGHIYKDLSERFFQNYKNDCWKRFGKDHRKKRFIRDFVLGLPEKDELLFLKSFKHMVEHDFSFSSTIINYSKLSALGLKNWKLIKTILKKK